MKLCVHGHIRGKVQGVSYRYYTQQKALSLGLSGWVRNISDGVEVYACGEKAPIDEFCEWLWQGAPTAQVQDVSYEEMAWQEFTGFEIQK